MRFAQALAENPVPRTLGDVRLRFEGGRLVGESRHPESWRRMLPGLCVGLAAGCALGCAVLLLAGSGAPGAALTLGAVAVAFVGYALHLEGRLGRRRFVLHFHTERLRLDTLAWAPGAARTEWVPFDAVSAVETVERPNGRYALVVCWRAAPEEEPRRRVLVEHIPRTQEEALFRVWRMLHNAFGLKGPGLGGG